MIRKNKTVGSRLAIISVMTSLLLLQGCGLNRMITIDSDPQGAVVTANGKQIGHTPVRVVPDEVFPPRIYGTSYRVKGKLGMEMAGCERYSQEVNDLVLSRDIKASLDCEPGVKAAAQKAAEQTTVQVNHVPKPKPKPKLMHMPMLMHMPVHAAPADDNKPAVSAPKTVGGADSDIEHRLQKLKALHDKGLITDKDYSEQRRRILNEI